MDLSEKEFKEFVKNKELCVVDFWAPWCSPCRALAPVLEEVCDELRIPLGKVDIDKDKKIAQEYGVMSIPCLILFKHGEEQGRKIGNVPRQSLMNFLEESL